MKYEKLVIPVADGTRSFYIDTEGEEKIVDAELDICKKCEKYLTCIAKIKDCDFERAPWHLPCGLYIEESEAFELICLQGAKRCENSGCLAFKFYSEERSG